MSPDAGFLPQIGHKLKCRCSKTYTHGDRILFLLMESNGTSIALLNYRGLPVRLSFYHEPAAQTGVRHRDVGLDRHRGVLLPSGNPYGPRAWFACLRS